MSEAERMELLRHLADHMEATIQADPQVLLERAGGPAGATADVVIARLIGLDDQTDDVWRLPRVERDLRVPIPRRPRINDMDAPPTLDMPVAIYDLQSSYASMGLDTLSSPGNLLNIDPAPPQFVAKVLYVRYRRRP